MVIPVCAVELLMKVFDLNRTENIDFIAPVSLCHCKSFHLQLHKSSSSCKVEDFCDAENE